MTSTIFYLSRHRHRERHIITRLRHKSLRRQVDDKLQAYRRQHVRSISFDCRRKYTAGADNKKTDGPDDQQRYAALPES